jgi:tRNA threonylcarbamoyladenosine biosynthesis protein TsaE
MRNCLPVMFISTSTAETEAVGARLAEKIQAGDILALVGDLGAGKTQFVKGLAKGLGCDDVITSPTFTLLHECPGGRFPIYHFDFYRIENLAALRAIGFEETIFGDGVSVIEWADRFAEAIPPQARWIKFEIVSEEKRRIDLSAFA